MYYKNKLRTIFLLLQKSDQETGGTRERTPVYLHMWTQPANHQKGSSLETVDSELLYPSYKLLCL